MKIYNVEEHLSCFCYDSKEVATVEVRRIMRMETDEIPLLHNEIVFILKGKLRMTLSDSLGADVSKGQFIFLPAGYKLLYKAFAKSLILIVRLKESINLCHAYSLDLLNNKIKRPEKMESLAVLDINSRLQHFADGLVKTWDDGLKCLFYLRSKINEALTMIRVYYPEEQLSRFFYFVLNSDTAFAEFVRMNHLKYNTVNELALAMEMTSQQFSKRFYNVFGQAPYKWMLVEKARLIYGDICRSHKSFKEIATDYGFTIPSNFNRFCKTSFGLNPGEIRRSRMENM